MLKARKLTTRRPVALLLMVAFLVGLVVTNVAVASDSSSAMADGEARGLVGGFGLSCEQATAAVAAAVAVASGGGPVTAAAVAVAGGLWLIGKCMF